MYDTQFNDSTAPDNALKPDGFALFNGRFVIKLCMKHSKPFSIPILHVTCVHLFTHLDNPS